ncbi:MAG: glycosyltransferase family 4 protein [Candidatus Zixiibacteriota bacterium]
MDYSDWTVFFVNKFNWLSKGPMATVSTMSTYKLAELGARTHLIIEGDSNLDADEILEDNFNLKSLENYTVKLINRYIAGRFKMTHKFYLKAVDYILKNRNRNGKNIVMSRNTTFLPYLSIFERLYNFTTLYEAHGYHGKASLEHLPENDSQESLLSHYRLIERAYLNRIDGMISIAKTQDELYKKDYLKIPSIVLPLGANIDHDIKLNDNFGDKMLVYAGRLTKNIDYEIIFKALAILDDIRFTWLGLKEKDIKKLMPYIKSNQIEDRVELIEWLPHSKMIDFLRNKATVGIVSYKNTFQINANISPTKIFDYFSCGLPAIANDFPSINTILQEGHQGYLYHTDNIRSFISCIEQIFENHESYNKMQKSAIERADYFSWKNRSKRILEFARGMEKNDEKEESSLYMHS